MAQNAGGISIRTTHTGLYLRAPHGIPRAEILKAAQLTGELKNHDWIGIERVRKLAKIVFMGGRREFLKWANEENE